MKLIAEVKVEAINHGEFKNDENETIKYSNIQFHDTVMKKLGDDYVEMPDIGQMSVPQELVSQIQKGKTYQFEVKAKCTNPKTGYPKVKYSVAAIVKGAGA